MTWNQLVPISTSFIDDVLAGPKVTDDAETDARELDSLNRRSWAVLHGTTVRDSPQRLILSVSYLNPLADRYLEGSRSSLERPRQQRRRSLGLGFEEQKASEQK